MAGGPLTESFVVSAELAGQTLAAVLRRRLPGQSWRQVRQLVGARHVQVAGSLCLDPARRVKEGEVIELQSRPAPRAPTGESVVIRCADAHLVVVEKPAGLRTVAHPAERHWPARRKALHPALVDLVASRLAALHRRQQKGPPPRLRIVQRLDKETSGLVVFARRVEAEQGLGKQFKAHTVVRRYLALVPGHVAGQRIASRLVRDRGDGRRGSTKLPGVGKEAVTHVEVMERLPGHTLLSCRLETGRTHQIRIHLAELGHPVCGEQVYNRRPDGTSLPACAEAPRLALHACELGFVHPVTGEAVHWSMPLPPDLSAYLDRLRARSVPRPSHADQVDRH
jgi:23S rRNA pseudouridine1911/1915/1917 synthase